MPRPGFTPGQASSGPAPLESSPPMGLQGLPPVLRGFVARLHLAAAILPLLFFGAFAGKAARWGFVPAPEAYPPYKLSVERNQRQIRELVQEIQARKPEGGGAIVACIWGLAAEPGGQPSAEAPAVELVHILTAAGVRVRATDPGDLRAARFLLGREAEILADPWAALQGADLLVLGCPWPDYIQAPDFSRVAATMAGRALLDLWGRWPGGAAEEAGLDYLRVGTDAWPMWLDPELATFEARFRAALAEAGEAPEEATVLLVPWLPMRSLAPRGRWYLPLNYRLLPARLLLPRPELACGTIPQYWDWVQRILEEGPARGAYWPEEYLQELIRRTGADWLLFFVQNEDFRMADWRLFRIQQGAGGGQDR